MAVAFLLFPQILWALCIYFTTEAAPSSFRIESTNPHQGAVGVGNIIAIQLTFSMPPDSSTINSETIKVIRLRDGYQRAIKNFTFSKDGRTVTIKLYRSLEEGEDYKILIKEGIYAFNGIPLSKEAPYYEASTNSWCIYFSTGSSTKMEYACIGGKRVEPGEEVVDVPIWADIEVVFSRALNPESVSSATVWLEKVEPKQEKVSIEIVYDSARKTIIVKPNNYLHYQSRYKLTITGVKDTLGNILQ